MNNNLYVVNHTHWDREWYQDFETYRFRMIKMIDKVVSLLRKEEIKYFLMDGQTVVLEDLKEVAEEDFNEFIEYIKQGRVIIGPWYVLPDEFLVSGESILRNLEIGMEESLKYGEYQKIGYLPDTFGHIGQLPQILKLYNIDSTVLWRGINEKKGLLKWKGSDGTEVKLLYLPCGYYFEGLLDENYIERIKEIKEKLDNYFDEGSFIELGGDHLEPPENYMERIKNLEDKLGINIIQTTPENFMKEQSFENVPKVSGELRDNSLPMIYMLPGVLSSRVYLKQQNQYMEDMLTSYVEPLNVIAWQNGNIYKKDYIKRIWKETIKNQPHDSICGCGIDEIHKEMESRYIKINSMIDASIAYSEECLFKKSKNELNKYLYIFNPLSSEFTGVIDGKIVVPSDFKGEVELYDGENRVDLDIVDVKEEKQLEADNLSNPDWFQRKILSAKIYVEKVKALGFKKLVIKEGNGDFLINKGEFIENQYYKITPEDDGTITVYIKEKGKTIKGLNSIIHSMDSGDEYNYSPPELDLISKAKLLDYYVVKGKTFSKLKMRLVLSAPEGLSKDRSTFSNRFKEGEIISEIILNNNDKTIRFNTSMDNIFKDMRLRVLMPIGSPISNLYTDTAFDLVKREVVYEKDVVVEKMQEAPVVTFPSLSTAVAQGDNTMVVSHRGLQEIKIDKNDQEDCISVTLLRAVQWLSRDDLRTRGGGAGPSKETPDAQCLRLMNFEYGVTFVETNEIYSAINISKKFKLRPEIIQSKEDKNILPIGELRAKNSVLSSLRICDGNLMATIYNPSDKNEEIEFLNKKYDIKAKEIKKLIIERA